MRSRHGFMNCFWQKRLERVPRLSEARNSEEQQEADAMGESSEDVEENVDLDEEQSESEDIGPSMVMQDFPMA